MNHRKEQLQYCRVCSNKAFDPEQGIVCGLTKKTPTFINTCPDFTEDAAYKQQEERSKEQRILDGVGIEGILRRLSIMLSVVCAATLINGLLYGVGIEPLAIMHLGFSLALIIQYYAITLISDFAGWAVFTMNTIFVLFVSWQATRISKHRKSAAILILILISADTLFSLAELSLVALIWHIILIVMTALALREMNRQFEPGKQVVQGRADILDA